MRRPTAHMELCFERNADKIAKKNLYGMSHAMSAHQMVLKELLHCCTQADDGLGQLTAMA